jgi:hypothetical protein
VSLEPGSTRAGAEDTLDTLRRRLDDITERAQRGADVGGLLPPLEHAASVFERDLIVGNARRRSAREELRAVQQLRTELTTRATALGVVAQRCVRTVDPAPRYAVPDVEALGPVPNTPAAIEDYRGRLERVGRALGIAESAYADALAERAELVDLLDALRAKADAHGLAGRDDLATSEAQARDVLARQPTPVPVARALVTAYQSWLTQLLHEQSAS